MNARADGAAITGVERHCILEKSRRASASRSAQEMKKGRLQLARAVLCCGEQFLWRGEIVLLEMTRIASSSLRALDAAGASRSGIQLRLPSAAAERNKSDAKQQKKRTHGNDGCLMSSADSSLRSGVRAAPLSRARLATAEAFPPLAVASQQPWPASSRSAAA